MRTLWIILFISNVVWGFSSKPFSRNWFIKRAEKKGVAWKELVEKNKKDFYILDLRKELIENRTIVYPDYYLKPFHGYKEGNLEWNAAIEGEAATCSISCTYWENTKATESEKWLRNNITENIKAYAGNTKIDSIVDFGCSVGVSTQYLYNAFYPKTMVGIDLSPYFLSVAQHVSDKRYQPIDFIHGNIEDTHLPSNHYDMVSCIFVVHEVPKRVVENILQEAYRILKKTGIVVIVDLDSQKVSEKFGKNKFRKWAFDVTEPHISSYYQADIKDTMKKIGYVNVQTKENDPMNSVWLGTKDLVSVRTLMNQPQKISHMTEC